MAPKHHAAPNQDRREQMRLDSSVIRQRKVGERIIDMDGERDHKRFRCLKPDVGMSPGDGVTKKETLDNRGYGEGND
jgi:hypothetical protein